MATYYDNGQVPDINYYKKPKYPILIESLKVFLLFAAAATLILYAGYDVAGSYEYAWFSLAFFAMPVISTMVRRGLSNVILYTLLHVLFLGWLFISPAPVLTMLGGVFWFALTLYGFVRQLSKESEREASMTFLLFTMVVMIGIYIGAVTRDRMGFTTLLMIIAITYGVLFMYYQHWIGVHDALRNVDKEGNFSVKRILGFNNKMFLAYLGLIVLLFAVMYLAGMGDIINSLTMMLIALIKKAARFLWNVNQGDEYVEEETQAEEVIENSNVTAWGETYTSPFWVVLQTLLEIVFVVVVVAFIVYALYSIFRRFNESHKYQEKEYEETKVFYKSVPKEKKQRRRSLREIFDNSPENRIRRAYYKKVRGHMGKRVFPYETTSEVAETVTDVKELVQAYDEARYAGKSLK